MKKWTKGEIILSDLLIALAFVYIVPFLMMILGSFKAQSQAAMFNLNFLNSGSFRTMHMYWNQEKFFADI